MPAPAEIARLIDEFGDLDRRLQAYSPDIQRHKQLAETIRSLYADADPECSLSAAGQHYVVTLTPAANERRIFDMYKVYRAFGSMKAFVSACSMTLKSLEQHLGPEKASKLVVESRTGSRRLKVVPRLAAVSADDRAA